MSELTTSQVNAAFFQKIASGRQEDIEKAAAAAEDYTRVRLREDGFFRKILPPEPITNDDLDRLADSDRNQVVVDKEIDSGPAMTVPYGTRPAMQYINTDRYAVTIARTRTKKYYKDISTFRTDRADIRKLISNNLVKDLLAEEDTKFIAVSNAIVGSAAAYDATAFNADNSSSNQHYAVTLNSSYIDRIAFNDALNVLPRLSSNLVPSTLLVNSIMVNDLQKWGLDELGSDLAGEILIKGWSERELLGKRLIVTIKRNLVNDNELFMYAEPKFMGHFYTIQDATIHMEREDSTIIKFFAFKEDGAAIGNTLSIGKATFSVASTGD